MARMRSGRSSDEASARVPRGSGGGDTLRALAAETLHYNDAGGYTFPDRDQYPHQWAWDSAFAAIGWVHLDPQRAYSELLTLVAAQNAESMVPHIAYDPRSSAKAYRPEAEVWGVPPAPDGRAVSAITQPPVAAIALRYVFEHSPSIDDARELVTRLHGWHSFLLHARDPGSVGEPVLIHPWESGRDNSVEWDEPMRRIEPVPFGSRADARSLDLAEHPAGEEYGRFYALVEEGRRLRWNQLLLSDSGSFRVLDSGFSAILAAACADLAAVANAIGSFDIGRQNDAAARQLTRSLLRRADDDGIAWSEDLVYGTSFRVETAGTALLALIPELSATVAKRIAEIVIDGELASDYGVRSLAASHQLIEPMRYWRGPVWSNISWLCALGLERNGLGAQAAELRARMLRAAAHAGMRESYEPDTGDGLGSRTFTWTAATTLAALAD